MQSIIKTRILKVPFLLFIAVSFVISCGRTVPSKPKVLLITGGHGYDTTEFFQLFESFPEFTIDTLSQPYANQFIADGKAMEYDALVFYDYWQTITDAEKKAYIDLTQKGTGFLFLHHSLVSYLDWEEFSKIRGGKYPKSTPPDSSKDGNYRHDIDIPLSIADSRHEITRGIEDFIIHDEGYNNIKVNEGITPVLLADHPDCAELFSWTNRYNNSEIVYLMGGHDRLAYENENYKKLIRNSLVYLTKRK